VVCKDSDSRPLDVIVRGVSNPLPPEPGRTHIRGGQSALWVPKTSVPCR
jgi:hypothetical protein